MNKLIQRLTISTFLSLIFIDVAYSKDITNLVINETQLDEQISSACSAHCQGNRRRGKLRRFLIERTSLHNFLTRAEVELRNYHHVSPPEVWGTRIGGGFAAYDYTIIAVAEGTLDEQTCMLIVEKIQLENDRLGLSSIARAQEGKTYHIEGCQRFTGGL